MVPIRLPRLILASGSPRRRELLEAAGYAFEVLVPSEHAECGICTQEGPAAMVGRLALQKAADVRPRVTQGILIACDTVAECQGFILGKPVDREHARQMLERLSGREHRVYSGLCVWPIPNHPPSVRVAVSVLKMDPLEPSLLEAYLDTGAWEGKAGALGFQDGLDWVHLIEGSSSNVVGLPMELLADMLAEKSE